MKNGNLVFISSASSDGPLVEQLAGELARHGVQTFLAQRDIPNGASWASSIKRALAASDAVAVFVSSASLSSNWVQFEIGAALSGDKTIIPVLSHGINAADLPPYLKKRTYVSMTQGDVSEAADRIVASLPSAKRNSRGASN